MPKREFLLLAHKFDPDKHSYVGWYASEKLDGIRCFWDGGISRGLPCTFVPWANTQRDARYLMPPIATGLWSRYGKAIQAPDWWLNTLPKLPLDGELTMGRGTWQELSSCVKQLSPDQRWKDVKYAVFDSPPLNQIFAPGEINNGTFKKKITRDCLNFAVNKMCSREETPFYKTLGILVKELEDPSFAYLHQQTQITSDSMRKAKEQMEMLLNGVLDGGGEGLILRSPISFWVPERSWNLLKVKPDNDAEGVVIGYKWGKESDTTKNISGESTDRLVGLMGSLRLKFQDVEFDLASGFNLPERIMAPTLASLFKPNDSSVLKEGKENQGKLVADWIENPKFPRGTKITFKYRELSDSGVPKEARYFRLREEE